MSKLLAFVAIWLVCLTALATAAPSPFTLDAREIAGGTLSHDDWRTSWGSYDRTTVGHKTVEITVRNVSRLVGELALSVHFVSNGQEIGNASRTMDLRGELELKTRVASPMTEMRTLNLESLRYRQREGTAPVTTWYVLARSGGKIIAARASSRPLQVKLEQAIANGSVR